MNNNFATLWNNPHLRYAFIGLAALQILEIWFPAVKPQLEETSKAVMFYATLAASNSAPVQTPAAPPPAQPKV